MFRGPILACVIYGFLLPVNVAATENSINVTINSIGKPYNYVDADGVTRGILRDIIEMTFSRIGMKAKFNSSTYTRAVSAIDTKTTDVITVGTMPRQPLLFPRGVLVTPRPLSFVPVNVYRLASSKINIQSYAELKNYKIGALRGDKRQSVKNLNIQFYPRNEFLFYALMKGEIDLAVAIPYFEHNWPARFGVSVVKLLQVNSIDTFMAFSSKSLGGKAAVLCREYYQSYGQLVREGEIAKLLTKAGVPDLIPNYENINNGEECVEGEDVSSIVRIPTAS